MRKHRLALQGKSSDAPPINNKPKHCIKKAILMSTLCFSMTQTAFATDVFLNEIHYDNASSDVGEAIEVAGVAGTDLSGWSIILYNGSNGTSYSTVNLSGIIPDQAAGFGTQSFAKSGIQNGTPDGFALVDNFGVVVEFLSYEGTLTATNGAANGSTSIDIGVAETGSTPVGHSLQFNGSTWQAADVATFGTVNTGQVFDDSGDTGGGDTGGGDTGGDDTGGGDTGGGASGSVCVNCPDLEKVADATSFEDAVYYADVFLAVNGGHGTTAIKAEITTAISQNHKDLSYAEVWTAMTETDEDLTNSDNVILFYRGISKPKLSNGSGAASSDPENWNREHVWAKSHGSFGSESESGYTDIHHLRPTDISVNSTRSNLDFDSGGAEIGEAPGNFYDSNSFEPRDAVKGDVARMIFYMDARYEVADANMPDLQVVESTNTSGPELGRLCRLIEWHNADPIDAFEQKRNNTIYEYQGNRNPFIDHPEWVATLYGSAACTSDGGGDTGGGDTGGGDTGGGDTGGSASNIFINEIHYDNAGSDSGESIEIAGPSGTDLAGMTLVLYNGSNGTTYKTEELTGVLSDQQSGFGTMSFDIAGMQNGAPDGIALIDSDGNVLQFISYEGALTATNGPASGMTSTDIGVSETSNTAVGFSLQLAGIGFTSADFTWEAAAENTFSNINTNQTFLAGSVFINEIHYDNAGSDSGEAVEVAGPAGTDLSGLSLVLYNGSNGTTYKTEELSGVLANQQGGFGTLSFDIAGMQNGAPDGVALIDTDGSVIEFLSYEGSLTATNGPASGMTSTDIGVSEASNTAVGFSLQLGGTGYSSSDLTWEDASANTFNNVNTNQTFGSGGDTGGGDNGGGTTVEIGQCSDTATFIHDIQGNVDVSPLAGQNLVVEAIVTSVLPALDGFFIQESDTNIDADPSTSEGLFVFNTANTITPSNGDVVRVVGNISEFFGRTQISAAQDLIICGTGSVSPTTLSMPFTSAEQTESLEGMLVSSADSLTVSDNYNLAKFGEVTLSSGRLFIPTNIHLPGSVEAVALAIENSLNKVILDDGVNGSYPEQIIFPTGGLSAGNSLRIGDLVTELTGIMDYSFGNYRIVPLVAPTFVNDNIRLAQPNLPLSNLTIASFNVLNLFNGDGQGGGFPTARGADTAEELERQFVKTVAAIVAINADVIGLMEIENDGVDANSTLAQLVARINAVMGADTYAFVNTGGAIGTDAIAVALLYKPASVSASGDAMLNDNSIFNRPPLAQTFTLNNNGSAITVVVNHFKSKGGCDSASGADQDQKDGQACFNAKRVAQANELINWLATDATLSTQEDVLVMGDLNAYAMEDPIRAFTSNGYTNLIKQFSGARAYSYLFGGEVGYLDHALASSSLLSKVVDATEWHINADEPCVLDYNAELCGSGFSHPDKTADQLVSLYASDAYRMSDHDPVIIAFNFASTAIQGDFDGDGDVDINDIRGLMRSIQLSESIDLAFDLNNDGVVSMMDARVMMSLCTRTRCAAN